MKSEVVAWHTEPSGAELQVPCRCCGRPVFRGSGLLVRNSKPVADYWYDWSEGHAGLFSVAVRWGPSGGERIVVCQCTCDPKGTKLRVVDPDAAWLAQHSLGEVLSRARALDDPEHPEFFELFDAVIQFEPRLGPRVKRHEHVA